MNIVPLTRLVRRAARRRAGSAGDDRAQALIEFALLLPVLVLFILGLADFALLFMRYQAITDTAREGARMAVIVDEVTTDPTARAAEIVDALKIGLSRYGMDGANAQVVGDPNAACDAFTAATGVPATIQIQGCGWAGVRADPARVVIRVPNEMYMLGNLTRLFTGEQTITLSTSATMRNE